MNNQELIYSEGNEFCGLSEESKTYTYLDRDKYHIYLHERFGFTSTVNLRDFLKNSRLTGITLECLMKLAKEAEEEDDEIYSIDSYFDFSTIRRGHELYLRESHENLTYKQYFLMIAKEMGWVE